MGLFDNVDNGEKKRIIDIELSSAIAQLYGLLFQLNIDPDSFDESAWDEPLDMGGNPRGRVRHYIDLIETLKIKKNELG